MEAAMGVVVGVAEEETEVVGSEGDLVAGVMAGKEAEGVLEGG